MRKLTIYEWIKMWIRPFFRQILRALAAFVIFRLLALIYLHFAEKIPKETITVPESFLHVGIIMAVFLFILFKLNDAWQNEVRRTKGPQA